VNIDPGAAKNAYLKVKSISGSREDAAIRQFPFPDIGYHTKYFKSSGGEITSDVTDGGHGFEVGPGKAKRFRVRVKRDPLSATETCIDIRAFDADGNYSPVELAVNQVAPCGM
jgi:hypothetical protein